MEEFLKSLSEHSVIITAIGAIITAIGGILFGLVAMGMSLFDKYLKKKELDLKIIQAKAEHKHQISKETAQALYAEKIEAYKEICTKYQTDKAGMY